MRKSWEGAHNPIDMFAGLERASAITSKNTLSPQPSREAPRLPTEGRFDACGKQSIYTACPPHLCGPISMARLDASLAQEAQDYKPMFFGGYFPKVAPCAFSLLPTLASQGLSRWPTAISSLGSR